MKDHKQSSKWKITVGKQKQEPLFLTCFNIRA
jgi:hypothetical protein